MEILVFEVADTDYGVPLGPVREVVRAVEITPLAGAPSAVLGVIDYRGALAPVYSLRRRFRLPERPLRLSDVFLVLDAGGRLAALHADGVRWLVEVDDQAVREADSLVLQGAQVRGAVSVPDGVVLLYDVADFLSDAEAATLDEAIMSHARNAT